jgi:hypothetical protein
MKAKCCHFMMRFINSFLLVHSIQFFFILPFLKAFIVPKFQFFLLIMEEDFEDLFFIKLVGFKSNY